MRSYSTAEIARLQAVAKASMMDAGHVGVLGTPSGGEPGSGGWVYGDEIRCGFKAAKQGQADDGSQIAVTADTIRVPIGTAITRGDRFKVTKRNETTLGTAEVYGISGLASRGQTAKVMACDLVTGETTQ